MCMCVRVRVQGSLDALGSVVVQYYIRASSNASATAIALQLG